MFKGVGIIRLGEEAMLSVFLFKPPHKRGKLLDKNKFEIFGSSSTTTDYAGDLVSFHMKKWAESFDLDLLTQIESMSNVLKNRNGWRGCCLVTSNYPLFLWFTLHSNLSFSFWSTISRNSNYFFVIMWYFCKFYLLIMVWYWNWNNFQLNQILLQIQNGFNQLNVISFHFVLTRLFFLVIFTNFQGPKMITEKCKQIHIFIFSGLELLMSNKISISEWSSRT